MNLPHINDNVKQKLYLGGLALVVIVGVYFIYNKNSAEAEMDLGADYDGGISGILRGLTSSFGKGGGGSGLGTGSTNTGLPAPPSYGGGGYDYLSGPASTGDGGIAGGGSVPTGGSGGGGDAGTSSPYVASFAGRLQSLIAPLMSSDAFAPGTGVTADGTPFSYNYSKVAGEIAIPDGQNVYNGAPGYTDVINVSIAPDVHNMNPAKSFYADEMGYRTNQVAQLPDAGPSVTYTGEALYRGWTAGSVLPSVEATAPLGYTTFQNTPNEIMVVPIQPTVERWTGMNTGGWQGANPNDHNDTN